jgi:hypothetical protein
MNTIFNFVPLWTVGPLVLIGVVAWMTAPNPGRRFDQRHTGDQGHMGSTGVTTNQDSHAVNDRSRSGFKSELST